MPKFDITLAGEASLDIIMYGFPEELEPERELVATSSIMALGGSSAIVAHNLSVLGRKVGFITALGNDSLAHTVTERLSASGVDLSCKVDVNVPTGFTVLLPHENHRHMFTYMGTIAALEAGHLNFEYLSSTRHFHVSSFFLQRFREQLPMLLCKMQSLGITTSMDTNDDPMDRWEEGLDQALCHVDILFPNEREALKISGQRNLESAIAWLVERIPTVVVKQGPAGAMVISKGTRLYSSGIPVNVVDSIGAGDSFDAGYLSLFVKGASPQDCLNFANMVAAFSTTAAGGTEAFCNRSAFQEFIQQHSS